MTLVVPESGWILIPMQLLSFGLNSHNIQTCTTVPARLLKAFKFIVDIIVTPGSKRRVTGYYMTTTGNTKIIVSDVSICVVCLVPFYPALSVEISLSQLGFMGVNRMV